MKWKLVSVSKETDHPFLNFYVRHYEVEKKDGKHLYDYYVSSRRKENELLALTHDFSTPEGILILLYSFNKEENQYYILLEKQFRPAVNGYLYSIPAGLMEISDNSIQEAAKRESKEETGAIIDHVELLIPPSPSSTGLSDEKLALVKGEVVDFSKTDREPFEDIEFSFLPICKVKEMLSKPDKYTFSFNGRLSILFLISQLENKI